MMLQRRTGALAPGLKSPVNGEHLVRAVLFDVDGTLYRQAPLRAAMAVELATLPLRTPRRAVRYLRAITAYRAAQEDLRSASASAGRSLRHLQLRAAATAAELNIEDAERLIDEWMFVRPLKYLPYCRAGGLIDLLSFLGEAGLLIGALSDYPADAKLKALGIADRFSVVLSAFDSRVNAFKPSVRGFECAARAWGLSAREVLVVGDRIDADADGAAAAGMDCVVVGSRPVASRANCIFVQSLERLHSVLFDCR